MTSLLDKAFALAERGLSEQLRSDPKQAREVLFAAITAFEAVLSTTKDAATRDLIATNIQRLKQQRQTIGQQDADWVAKEKQLDARLLALKGESTLEDLQSRLSMLKPAPSKETLDSLNARLTTLTGKPPLSMDTTPVVFQVQIQPPLSFEQEAQLLIQQVTDEIAAERRAGLHV